MSIDRADSLRLIMNANEAGQPALILELARRYLARWPDDRYALHALGDALASIARYPEARAAYDRELTLTETEAQRYRIYAALGHLAWARSEVQEAEDWFRRAIAARPDDAGPRIYLGALLAKHGRLDDAAIVHSEATHLTKGAIDEAWLNLGYVRRAQRDYVEALDCFRRALAIDPLYVDAQDALADIEQVLFEFPPEPPEGSDG